jgi:alkanesulfonate monooxygenase SsuD/methylene tetrahydromethanopterin reductase-like flavin-dependent oxidoreductase (luciferase family)
VLAHEQFRTDQLVSQAQAAEKAGFQYVWASDHLQPWQDTDLAALSCSVIIYVPNPDGPRHNYYVG